MPRSDTTTATYTSPQRQKWDASKCGSLQRDQEIRKEQLQSQLEQVSDSCCMIAGTIWIRAAHLNNYSTELL